MGNLSETIANRMQDMLFVLHTIYLLLTFTFGHFICTIFTSLPFFRNCCILNCIVDQFIEVFKLGLQVTRELFCDTALRYSKGNFALFDIAKEKDDNDADGKGRYKGASLGGVSFIMSVVVLVRK